MRILILGGTLFVGRHLVESAQEMSVACLRPAPRAYRPVSL